MYEELIACHTVIKEFAMTEPINAIFAACVLILEVIGEWTGMGYNLANIVIFIALQPGLILLFFILWRREKKKSIPSLTHSPIAYDTSFLSYIVLDPPMQEAVRSGLHAYFRQEYGLQNKVARLAGYNTSVFSKYITGRRRLPIGFVEHVLPYTTLTLNGLLNQKDN